MQIYGEIFKITGRQFRKIITDSDQFQPVVRMKSKSGFNNVVHLLES